MAQQQLQVTMQNMQDIRDQMRLDQRARVWLTGVTFHPLTTDQPISITTNTVNSGKSVASNVERASAIVHATKEPTSFPRLDKWQTFGTLTPNLIQTDNIRGKRGLTQPEIDAINSGALLVVIYGTLKYDDAFGTPHFTDCVVYTPDANGFSSCKRHNRAD